jgi:hypothetical protein
MIILILICFEQRKKMTSYSLMEKKELKFFYNFFFQFQEFNPLTRNGLQLNQQ